MKAERARILDMLHQGAISVDQAEELLDALQRSYQAEAAARPTGASVPTAVSGPAADPMGFASSITQRVMQGLSGAFGALKGVSGSGRTNFSHMRLTNDSLANFADGSSLTNLGHLSIADDVRPELLQQKVAHLTNFGAVTGPSTLRAILESRCDTNFGSFGEEEDEDENEEGVDSDADEGGRPVLKNVGRTVVTREQLQHMADGTVVKNIGRLTVAPDVPPDLLAQKVGEYVNVGRTCGPAALLGILQARCPMNTGSFEPDGACEDEGRA